MKRVILGAVAFALASALFAPTANAICHHCTAARAPAVYYRAAPAPVFYQAPVMHQVQTIGGPTQTTYVDSAPVYGAPETIGVSAGVEYAQPIAVAAPAIQAAPAVQYVEAAPVTQYTEAAPVSTGYTEVAPAYTEAVTAEATHSVEAIAEVPVQSEVVTQAPVAAAPVQQVTVQVAAPAPVQAAPVQIQYVAAPAQPTFVQTPPANRATVIETFYQPQQMYFQPAPIMMMQMPAPRGHGCLGCRLH